MATSLERLQNPNYAFVTCGIKVNTRSSGWQKTVRRVLSKIHGVRDCRMDEHGVIQVSGIVSPELLVRKLSKAGRKAELLWLQYGQCSSGNSYAPMPMPDRSSYADYHTFHGHDAYGYGPHGGPSGYYGLRHSYRPFAGLVHEIQQQQQRRANLAPMHTVYIPRYRYGGDSPGCCNLM